MLEEVQDTRTISAWVEEIGSRGRTSHPHGDAPLKVQVVHESPMRLLVEVTTGAPPSRGTMLQLEDRGAYEVEVVLRRDTGRGVRWFMGLGAVERPGAA
jgi:hypothetical protein